MPFSYASLVDAAGPHDWDAERLRLVIEAVRIGTFDYDVGTGTLVWSDQCKVLFGLQKDQRLSYERFLRALHPDDRNDMDAAIRRSLDPDGEGDYASEFRVVWPDGTVHWLGARGKTYFVEHDGTRVPIRLLGTVLDVTNRRRDEETIREQAERQHAALLASGTGTFRWNMRTGAIDWDRALARLCGLPEDGAIETLGAFLDLVHPDDQESVVAAALACAEIGAGFDAEFRIVRPDGETRWLLGQGATTCDEAGRPLYMVGACVDITSRRATEAALRLSEENFRSLAESIPQPVWLTDASGWIFWYNRRWYELTGTTFDDMEGWGWQKVHHPDFVEGVTERIKACFASGEPWEDTFPLRRHDGEWRWFLSRALPVRNEAGRIVRWVGTNTDITEQRRIEAALLESETKFRAIANSMPQMVWSTRADGYHDYFNDRWFDFTGVPRNDTYGDAWRELVHPEDRETVAQAWRHSLATGAPYNAECRLRRHDGVHRWILARAVPVRDEATGELLRWFGTCTDIQEVKRIQEELREALEAKEALLYEVNHRVKNSLAVVTSLLTLQASRARDPSLRQSLMEARGRVSVVAQVHQRLYTSSRHDSVELRPFLTQIAHDVEGLLDTESRVHLQLDMGDDDGILSIDKAVPLALIISELLTNAMKYAFPDGRKGTVTLGLESTAEGLRIIVEDDGIGLPAGFDPSVSTGFGMRIVTALSRQIRATLMVTPQPSGARFELLLPATTPDDGQ